MISKFVREQKRYTQQDLCSILECTESEVVGYIRKLKEYGVLKAVKASDLQKDLSELQEEDIEIADVEDGRECLSLRVYLCWCHSSCRPCA